MEAEKSPHSREAIMKTALQLFSLEGYHAVTIRRLAAEHQMAVGLLYNYFKNKESLLAALLSHGFELIEKGLVKMESEPLQNQVILAYELLFIHHEYWKLYQHIRTQQALFLPLKDACEAFQLRLLEHFRKAVKSKGLKAAKSEALLIVSALDGFLAINQTCPPDYILSKSLGLLADRYL